MLACAWLALPLRARGDRADLRFLKLTDLPGVGLQLKLMPDFRETPLPPPTVYSYTLTRGDDVQKVDMYSPQELWRQGQSAGRWTDEHGNALVLARILGPLPGGFSMEHATREEYQSRLADASAPDNWSTADLARWAADFTGHAVRRADEMQRPPRSLRDLVTVTFRNDGARHAFAFRLSRSASGQSRAAKNWFFLMMDVNPAVNRERAGKAIAEKLLPSITVARKRRPSSKTASRNFKERHKREMKSVSEEYALSRRQVAESISNMKDWWYAETPNYIMLSNLGSRYRVPLKKLQENIEVVRRTYETLVPPRFDPSAVSVIRIFGSSSGYEAYVGPEYAWSGGLWIARRKELVVRPAEQGGSRELSAGVRRVTYHEAFHQYIFYALDKIEPSAWFNEGHASFFENAEVTGRRVIIREEEPKVRHLHDMIRNRTLDVPSLLELSHAAFYAPNDSKARAQNYCLAWAVIYYLQKGARLERPPRYAGILERYTDALVETRDAAQATTMAFEGINLRGFESDLVEFWISDRKRSAARRNHVLDTRATLNRR